MREMTFDEYYLTEQDERTVQVQLGSRASAPRPRVATRQAVPGGPPRRTGGVRRRLHILRRAAGVALAA